MAKEIICLIQDIVQPNGIVTGAPRFVARIPISLEHIDVSACIPEEGTNYATIVLKEPACIGKDCIIKYEQSYDDLIQFIQKK